MFETGGVTGWIRFYQKAADNITFVANLEGLSANASWSLHLLPVDLTLDPQIRCGDNFLGGIYNPGGVMTTCTPQNPEMCAAGDFSGRFVITVGYISVVSLIHCSLSILILAELLITNVLIYQSIKH